jgi:D-alanyl-D-alanine carboxypeptidase
MGPTALVIFMLVAALYSAASNLTFGRTTEAMSRPATNDSAITGRLQGSGGVAAVDVCPHCDALPFTLAQPTPSPTPEPPAPAPAPAVQAPPQPAAPPPQPLPPFDVPSRAVAIIEAPCGHLVYGKDEHLPLPPASLTKIVTALTAIDRLNLPDRVSIEISGKALKQRTRSSIMGLEPGMDVTAQDLLYGLFLPSGNDASIEIAEHVSGSVETFVQEMNQVALSLGLHDSHFTNPHGLDSAGLVSSAHDMAQAGMVMMRHPVLAHIAGARSYTLEGGLTLRNGNKLLGSYAGAYGVKIGFTNRAKHTIVGAASRGGRDLYISVLGSENLYPETSALLDWAFRSTTPACG